MTEQNKLFCNKSLYYKLQLPCQQVLDALCHQPKGWSTNRKVSLWQTMQDDWSAQTELVAVWQAICAHWWQAKQTLCNLQQVALLQAAVALSASLGRVMSSTKGQLRHKLWDDWGTNRTVTVWQTVQVLSDKLTRRCVTSYLSAMVTSKTNSYATSRFNYKLQLPCQQVLDALCHQPKGNCVTSYGMTEAQTEQSLCDKLWRYYPTN